MRRKKIEVEIIHDSPQKETYSSFHASTINETADIPGDKNHETDDEKIDFRVTPASSVFRSQPLGLHNRPGDNVCFFNSVMQVLYSIRQVREDIGQMEK